MSFFDFLLKRKKPVKKVPVKKVPVKRVPVKVVRKRPTRVYPREEAVERTRRRESERVRQQARQEAQRAKDRAQQAQLRIGKKEAEVARREGAISERERLLGQKEKRLEEREGEVNKIKKQQLAKLERAASLTSKEARELILKATEKKLQAETARIVKEKEETAKEKAEGKAREILVNAMYHAATDYVPEYTVSTIKLEDEDIKGRIIGREGRNIRTFEKATGVDVDLDEESMIRLSSFDPVRREVAKVALKKLIVDGRIQPSRIEETVSKTRKDIEKVMYDEGKKLCHQLKVFNLPNAVIVVLGRLKYRFSYGQNMIAHTLEETKIGVSLAHEVGADVNVVKLGCLLHDIGKVITEEEGSHVDLGVDFLRKHGIPQAVLDCVAQHHEDKDFTSLEAMIVFIADAISGSRPGARYEDYEEYVKRLKKLEELARRFEGVKEAYAIQAGREIRVVVNPEKISDGGMSKLALDLRDKIQKELTFPGQVKVNVIRERRVEQVAR